MNRRAGLNADHKISVFMEPGKLKYECLCYYRLALVDIPDKMCEDILGSVTNDSAEYGIVRMVVSEPDKAMEALIAAGYLCHVIEVIGVEVEDKTGNLNDLLLTLKDSNVSVDYLYLSFNRDSGKPIMVFHTEDIMEVRSCLKSRGYTVL